MVDVIVNSAASYIEDLEFGTFVPARVFNEALAGTDALLSFKSVGDRLRERNSSHAFYIVKGSGGSPVGFVIIRAQALEDIRSAQYSRSAPRPRDDKPRDASPPAQFRAPDAPGSRR